MNTASRWGAGVGNIGVLDLGAIHDGCVCFTGNAEVLRGADGQT